MSLKHHWVYIAGLLAALLLITATALSAAGAHPAYLNLVMMLFGLDASVLVALLIPADRR